MISQNIKEVAYKYVEKNLLIIPCESKKKKSLLKEWQNKKVTTKEELETWFEKNKEINIGLPLGENSLLIGIDVDGEEASDRLEEISNGELPDTWEFKTPNGYRYLYKIFKGLGTRKWSEKLDGEHNEIAILAQGQYTILPPSVNSEGEHYKWSEGKDPESIEVAEAPKWILDLITESPEKILSSIGKKTDYKLGDVDKIYDQCKWFKHCKEESRTLSEPEWFNCLTVINTCKDPEKHAIDYSKDYPKYNKDETLKKLQNIKNKSYSPVSCSIIKSNGTEYCKGCTLGVGSPATLGRNKTRAELEQVGFYFDDKGIIKGLNGNQFADYLLTRIEILFNKAGMFYMYKDNYWQYIDGNLMSRICRDIVHEFVPNYWNPNVEAGYFEALKRVAIRVDKLDEDRTKINIIDGIFDLNLYSLKAHSQSIRSSIQIPVKYDDQAEYPAFKKFLEDVYEGDVERINLTQEMFGYCLTSDTSAQKAFILYGRGSNGKSMLAEVLMRLIGKANTSAVPLTELNNPFSRYELVDKLLNIATENEVSDGGLNTTFFKSIVSGDAIQVEKKFEQGFMYQPICKLVFCLNNLPYSKDKSWGFQRRLIVIPFNKIFKEDDPNTLNYSDLREDLLSELDGIFVWALEGLKRLSENKFKFSKSKAVDEALEHYKEDVNPYYNFSKDNLEQGDQEDKMSNKTLVNLFKEWANENGHKGVASASNQKIVKEIRNVLEDMHFDIKYGENIKLGANRCTQKIRVRSAEVLDAEEAS